MAVVVVVAVPVHVDRVASMEARRRIAENSRTESHVSVWNCTPTFSTLNCYPSIISCRWPIPSFSLPSYPRLSMPALYLRENLYNQYSPIKPCAARRPQSMSSISALCRFLVTMLSHWLPKPRKKSLKIWSDTMVRMAVRGCLEAAPEY